VSYVDSVSSDGSITIIDNGAEGQGYGQPAVLTAAELQFDLLANQQFRPDEVSSQAGTWFIHQHP